MSNIKSILDKTQETFFNLLDDKTSWGRNEIKAMYKDAVLDVVKEELDKDSEEEN